MSDATVRTRLAKVVHVIDPDMGYAPIEVVINRGAADGVKIGDRFLVFGDGPMITDPDTNRELGQLEVVRGRGEVVHVQEHLATVRSIDRQKAYVTKRTTHEAATGIAYLIGSSNPRAGKVLEEELLPQTIIPFEHVRIGDQAKPI